MNIFITGITGTLGQEVTRKLLGTGHKITGLTRDELKLKQMRSKYDIDMCLGDVRNRNTLIGYTKDADIILHFAALKHIELMEHFIDQCHNTNLLATSNVIAAQDANNIGRVVFTSTDKAAYPVNNYGLCKAMSERLILNSDRNAVCRYGNVLASNGSVIHTWKDQILKGDPITITDSDMTRFWITISDAADFVIGVALGEGVGLNIPPMKAYPIKRIPYLIAELLGKTTYLDIRETGLRPGEKIHECLSTRQDGEEIFSDTADQYSKEEMLKMIKEIL